MHNWINKKIIELEELPEWLLEISTTVTCNEICNIMGNYLNDEHYNKYNKISLADVILGYYYLRYSKEELQLIDLLKISGEFADGTGLTTIECEEFYDLLNKYENNKIKNINETLQLVDKMYYDYMIAAKKQFHKFLNYK